MTSSQPARNRMRNTSWVSLFVLIAAALGAFLDAKADPPSGSWELSFADEFTDRSLNTKKWRFNYPWGTGHTHNHDAYVDGQYVSFDDGIATLTATRESVGGKLFTSGTFTTASTYRLSNGYLEASIKMPSLRGSWPAFWMLSDGWPPEIDMMEYVLFTDSTAVNRYSVNSHWGSGSSNFSWIDTSHDLGAGFHTYGLHWHSGLGYYFDDGWVKSASNQPEFVNMYIIVNYAVGGWPGVPSLEQWPQGASDEMEVDWVRVWQPHSGITQTNWTAAGNGWWNTGSNWSNGAPYHGGQKARFGPVSASNVVVDWNNFRFCGDLEFDGTTNYTLGAGGDDLLQLAARVGLVRIDVYTTSGNGTHVINADLEIHEDAEVRVRSAAPLTVNGAFGGPGDLHVVEGNLVLANNLNAYRGSTLIDGTLTLVATGRTRSNIPDTPDVQVNEGGVLDATGLPSTMLVSAGQIIGGAGRLEGSFTFRTDAVLKSEGLTIDGSLALDDGARLSYVVGPNGAPVVVSGGALTGSGAGGVTVALSNGGGLTPGGTYTLLDWSGATASGVDMEDFVVAPGGATGTFAIVGQTLTFTLDSLLNSQTVNDGGWNDAIWGTPATTPNSGTAYATTSFGDTSRVRASIPGDPNGSNNTTFEGDSLRIVPDTELLLLQTSRQRATADLELAGGTIRLAPQGAGDGRMVLQGTLDVAEDSAIVVSKTESTMTINSTVTGNGRLRMEHESPSSSGDYFFVTGDISAFAGEIEVADGTSWAIPSATRMAKGGIVLEPAGKVVLNANLGVGRAVVDGYALPAGSYTADELNTVVLPAASVGNGANFDGSSRLVVGGCVWSDLDADGDVDGADAAAFVAAMQGPDVAATADLDGDGDLDLVDFAMFQAAFAGCGM